MTQNSVLSQNWVGCTPNGPSCAHTVPRPYARRRVVAHPRPYRGPLLDRVTGAPCRVVVGTGALACRIATSVPAIQKLYRDIKPLSYALSCVSQRPCAISQGAAAPYHSFAALYRDPKVAPPSRYRTFIATHPQR